MSPTPMFETREVLAAAYPTRAIERRTQKTFLSHTVEINENRSEVRVLCKRVKLEHICDPGANPNGLQDKPTCPVCARRDPRFKAAETK